MKKQFSLLVLLIFICSGFGQNFPTPETKDIWAGMIELEQSIHLRHALHDIPGSIVVLIPENGKYDVRLLGSKVLLDKDKLPELKQEPTLLISSSASKTQVANAGFLSFVSANMENTDVVKYVVTETGVSISLDNEIDWAKFSMRENEIKKKNPNLPQGTRFGVVKVASIISIYHEYYKKVSRAGKISGWGFNSEAKILTQKENNLLNFKIGVALTYSDSDIEEFRSNMAKYPEPGIDAFNIKLKKMPLEIITKDDLSKILNISYANNLARPGRFVEDIEEIIKKK